MMLWNPHIVGLVVVVLSGCKAASTSECLSTSSGEIKISDKSEYVQGGYLHFGEKSCSASFDVVGIASDHIRLKAYSARHCRFENGLDLKKVSASLYFSDTSSSRAGYVKNIPVSERFVDRASAIMEEVRRLNSPKAESLFLNALRLPTQFDPWSGGAYAEYSGTDSKSSLICRDHEQIPPIPDPQNQLTDSCWSFLDLGTYDLVIRKNSIPSSQFFYLTQNLSKKSVGINALLNSDSTLKASYYESRRRIDSIMTLLRSHQAAWLGTLLNFDLCHESVRTNEMCKNQSKMIEILAKNFIESDSNGTEKNIFDWIHDNPSYHTVQLRRADLLSGRRVPITPEIKSLSDLESAVSGIASEFRSDLLDKSAVHIIKMREIVAKQSRGASIDTLSPAYFIGSNFVGRNDKQGAGYRFGLFSFDQVFSDPKLVKLSPAGYTAQEEVVHGVTKFGTLRVAFPHHTEVVKFQPTDSGSLITLHGVIPLMVLNTVNDEATSGGSAILALPEIDYDDEPLSTNVAQPHNSDGSKTVSVRVNDSSFSSNGSGCL